MKIAFLFSGQGAQYIGMGKELYDKYPQAKEVFDQVNVDFDVAKLCFEGPQEVLNDTAYAQTCIFSVSMAIAKVLDSYGIKSDGCAGLSLGEYSAYAYAQSMGIQDGANILRERGKLMAHSLPVGTTTMAAVLMLDADAIKKACMQAQVEVSGICEIANYNCPGQIVITGDVKTVERASALCLASGARKVIPLVVSGAFHSSLLQDASKQLKEILNGYEITSPKIDVYNNISGFKETGDIKDILSKQICNSVYFEQTIANMVEDGYDTFIEVGPGTAITGFVKKCTRGNDVKIFHVEDEATLQSVVEEMK